MCNIVNTEHWQDLEYGHLLDRPKKPNHVSGEIFEGMSFSTKIEPTIIVNPYCVKNYVSLLCE